jgi:sugar lactone lactonase YvrE
MATVVPVTTFPFETSRDVAVTTWDNMLMDDDGEPVRLAVYSDRSIQVAGTFGGASVTIGGSNDGETYHALHDTSGAVMTLTEGKLQQIVELPIYIKPRVFGGDGTTSLRVLMSGRKSI